MNAIVDSMAPAKAPAHKTHRFKLLLQREFWEHKGGFLWAPLVAGGIFLVLSMMGIVLGLVAAHRVPDRAQVSVDGGTFSINGIDLNALTSKMSAHDLAELGQGLDVSLFMAATWPLIVLAFVVFFYCLGSLYDERKDRSVLFWKSLPVSDAETVLSKVASATLVAPALATVVGVLAMLGFLVILSVTVLFHGGNPVKLLWGPASPLQIGAQLLAAIPIFAGIFVTWFDLMQLFNLEAGWFWKHIVARALLSTVPGSDLAYRGDAFSMDHDGIEGVEQFLSLSATYGALARPETWIGAVVGATMIFGAIRLRRWRDEG